MSYNLMCETKDKINWESFNKYIPWFENMEFIPMPSKGINGGDAIGISVPLKNVGKNTMKALEMIYLIVTGELGCTVYDLYTGQVVTEESLRLVYEQIT